MTSTINTYEFFPRRSVKDMLQMMLGHLLPYDELTPRTPLPHLIDMVESGLDTSPNTAVVNALFKFFVVYQKTAIFYKRYGSLRFKVYMLEMEDSLHQVMEFVDGKPSKMQTKLERLLSMLMVKVKRVMSMLVEVSKVKMSDTINLLSEGGVENPSYSKRLLELSKKTSTLTFLSVQLEIDYQNAGIDIEAIGVTRDSNEKVMVKMQRTEKPHKPNLVEFMAFAKTTEEDHEILQNYFRRLQGIYSGLKREVDDAIARIDTYELKDCEEKPPIDLTKMADDLILSVCARHDAILFEQMEYKVADNSVGWAVMLARCTDQPKVLSKKLPAPQGRECSNCALTDESTLKPCSRCRSVWYCDKACQTQHWKEGGHKRFCVAVADRAPSKQEAPASDEEKCVVCLDPLKSGKPLSLGCGHILHAACMADVISFGVANACPTCRRGL